MKRSSWFFLPEDRQNFSKSLPPPMKSIIATTNHYTKPKPLAHCWFKMLYIIRPPHHPLSCYHNAISRYSSRKKATSRAWFGMRPHQLLAPSPTLLASINDHWEVATSWSTSTRLVSTAVLATRSTAGRLTADQLFNHTLDQEKKHGILPAYTMNG